MALIQLMGANYAVLQATAWVGMVVNYSKAVPDDRLRDQFWHDSNEVPKVSSLRMLVMRFFACPAFEDKELVGTSFDLMKFE